MEIPGNYKQCYLMYNRKSTDDAHNQRNSLIYQRQRNIDYADRQNLPIANGLTIPGFCTGGIVDESHSGFKEEDEFDIRPDGAVQYRVLRPKFLKLAELLKAHTVKGAIFLCWDRASRNPHDDLIIKKLARLGCDIRFAEASYDNTSSGELHRDIDGVFATHYSRSISEKVKNAQNKLRAERRCIYGAPIGYLDRGSDSKPLDPDRAPMVKRIFELYATGDWSIQQLAKWAQAQGLTKKPVRRKRTREEIANNVEVASISKIARPADRKTIEYMLPNPFYVGKVKIGNSFVKSISHQALIDTTLFNRVQEVLREKRASVYYVDKPFYIYRGLARCECGRLYTPYIQKGIVYYRSACKEDCINVDPNLNESDITAAIQRVMDKIHFSDEELAEINEKAKTELGKISERRDKTLDDLHGKQRIILADLDYIAQNKITLLRTGSMDAETMQSEQSRLEAKLASVAEEIKIYAESAPEMLRYVLAFSELAKNAGLCFEHALDSERREITASVFSELIFKNRELVGYEAREGFAALLGRISGSKTDSSLAGCGDDAKNGVSGSAVYLFSELYAIYPLVRSSIEKVNTLACLARPIEA